MIDSWVGLLRTRLLWQSAQHLLVLGKLVLREETFGSDPSESCVQSPWLFSELGTYFQLLGGNQGQQQQSVLFRESLKLS